MKALLLSVGFVLLLTGCQFGDDESSVESSASVSGAEKLESFCDRLPRPQWAALEKHEATNDWFEVYEVASNTFAIYEPFQWQEIISYLIVGNDSALLFDTGNGIGDIRQVVDQLTTQPVIVINSHSHFDHVGGNHQFDDIRSVSTSFSIERSRGLQNNDLKLEVSPEALCKPLPNGVTPENHRSKSYSIQSKLVDGESIDLGGRLLEVIRIPGHTDDSIALLDRDRGFLWTGDSFYEGPIWLYAPETDLDAYAKSLETLARLAPTLKWVFPAHNSTRSNPELLLALRDDFAEVRAGRHQPIQAGSNQVVYQFEAFSFLLRKVD